VHFVTFHLEPGATALKKIPAFCRVADYRVLLTILFRSVELFHPGAKAALLSDERTPFESLPAHIDIVRAPIDPDRVLYSRLLARMDYVRRHAGTSPVVFLDSDMIVNADLGPLVAEEFDVALTYRDHHRRVPINGGLAVVKGGPQGAGLRFLERVRSIYVEEFSTKLHWGDQRALISAVGYDRFALRTSDLIDVDGTRILLLPCEQYNFSPENDERAIAGALRDKRILHFKGERKRLMPLYWDKYLDPMRPTSVIPTDRAPSRRA
jgi:hypothetical protein